MAAVAILNLLPILVTFLFPAMAGYTPANLH